VTTLGELAASIAHEVNQPLAAIVADAHACLNCWRGPIRLWTCCMGRWPPSSGTATGRRTSSADSPAGGEAASPKAAVDVNDVVREGDSARARSRLLRHEVSLAVELASELPRVLGDRVQLQQVILNLVMNATEAMAGSRTGRES